MSTYLGAHPNQNKGKFIVYSAAQLENGIRSIYEDELKSSRNTQLLSFNRSINKLRDRYNNAACKPRYNESVFNIVDNISVRRIELGRNCGGGSLNYDEEMEVIRIDRQNMIEVVVISAPSVFPGEKLMACGIRSPLAPSAMIYTINDKYVTKYNGTMIIAKIVV